MFKTIIKTALLIILVLIVLLMLIAVGFRLLRGQYRRIQVERIEWLKQADDPSLTIRDTLIGEATPVNHIRYLATHNSYHLQAGVLQLLILDLFEPGEASALKYSHFAPYTQLDLGIRSFEFDLRYYGKNKFETVHVPLVDNRSNSPDLGTALDEMRLWSDRNTEHVPIIVIMELKNDWRILDPFQKKWTADSLLELDGLIALHLGDRLIKPSDLIRAGMNLRESLEKDGWPALGDSRGSFIFVYHESDEDFFNDEYLGSGERVCFFMTDPDTPEASFILRNDPSADDIDSLVKNGFIVRTRADADCIISEEVKNRAVASGAQIVSTDYPAGYPSAGDYSLGWNELLRKYVY